MSDRDTLDEQAGRSGWIGWVPRNWSAYLRGAFARSDHSGGGGGGGLGVFLLFALAPAMMTIGPFVLIPLYPVLGTLACVAGGLFSYFFPGEPGVSEHITSLPAALIGLGAFLGMGRYEQRAEESWRYVEFRHWTRTLLVPIAFDTLVIPVVLNFLGDRQNAYDWGLLSGVTFYKLLRIGGMMIALHVILRLRERS